MFQKLTFAFLFLLNSCTTQQKILSKNDWYGFTKAKNERIGPSKVYDFTDGMIRMYGENIGYLMTKKSYKNFELRLDFRWNIEEKFNKGTAKKEQWRDV